MNINLDDLQRLQWAISDVVGFETDNSCGDPECCGGPLYDHDEFADGLKVMAEFGLTYTGVPDAAPHNQ